MEKNENINKLKDRGLQDREGHFEGTFEQRRTGREGVSPQDMEWDREGRMFQVEDPEAGDTWRNDRPAGLSSMRRNKVKR